MFLNFFFKKQFKLTKQKANLLVELNCFVVKHYTTNWFSASNSEIACLNDIRFLIKLYKYSQNYKTIFEATIVKLLNDL